jgi:mono/diheme cytochrome c family protein
MRWFLLVLLASSPAAVAADPPVVGSAAAGKATFTARCSSCHGASGKGDGPAARALPRPPTDLTSATFWENRTDADIASILANGTPGGVMRAFPMRPEQAADLIAYLRTFQPPPPAG